MLRECTSAGFLESLRCRSEEFRDTPVGIRVLTEVSKQGNSMLRHVLLVLFLFLGQNVDSHL